jgi:hypothetical protein
MRRDVRAFSFNNVSLSGRLDRVGEDGGVELGVEVASDMAVVSSEVNGMVAVSKDEFLKYNVLGRWDSVGLMAIGIDLVTALLLGDAAMEEVSILGLANNSVAQASIFFFFF